MTNKKQDASFPSTTSPKLVGHETGLASVSGRALRPTERFFLEEYSPGKTDIWEGAPRALDTSSSPSPEY